MRLYANYAGLSGLEDKIDYLAERQNGVENLVETERKNGPCRGEDGERNDNYRLRGLSGLEGKIDYLAERQNGARNKGG